MLAASHSLIAEGAMLSTGRTLIGILVGLALILGANTFINRGDDRDIADLAGADARKALLILGIMTAHSFAEGVGVSYGGGDELGAFQHFVLYASRPGSLVERRPLVHAERPPATSSTFEDRLM